MAPIVEPEVKVDVTEAHLLYERGVAAARADNRRVAAGFLTRALRLDPRNESAWLWLSGVLDDPHERAFCLRSVLTLNPHNTHAQRGLRLLETRGLLNGQADKAPAMTLPSLPVETKERPVDRDAWWINWRRSNREWSRSRLLFWIFPILLLVVAIGLYQSFVVAVERSAAVIVAPTEDLASVALFVPPLVPTIEPVLEAEPLAVVEGLTIGYLGALESLRADLRVATETYREATTMLAGGSVGAVAATQRLRATVASSREAMSQLRPPGTLQPAHDDYLTGLNLQLEGLDAVLDFYSGYDVAYANRAAQRFQEARAYLERAQATFATEARQLADLSSTTAQTPR
ncbi:hypothetical protein A9Q02_10370 [Candidatus Chloroploca asiatica]|uniref:Tetratricopeptide repeat protein n=1 Tax=Candidatus Chloroploca asiatica TaxID=1506545 RepID=A0A2H3LCK3_9CHLR|nr:hypothetical protein A9Q02_10370 [Candidatus Chloroploca asiatica]